MSKTHWSLAIAAGVVAVGIAVGSVFWAPWSTSWMSHHAYRLDVEGKDKEAAELYKKVIKRKPDAKWARENLQDIQIHEISVAANQAFTNREWERATALYDQILEIEPDNEFALQNKQLIREFIDNSWMQIMGPDQNLRETLSGVPQSRNQ